MREIVPPQVLRHARTVYRRLRPPFRFVSFDEAFPKAKKFYSRSSFSIPSPEILGMPIREEDVHLKSPTYSVPDDYTTILDDALYYARHSVLMADKRSVVRESIDVPKLVRVPAYDRPVHEFEGYSTFIRSTCSVYYHQLIEQVPRLLALDRPPFSDLPEINLLCPNHVKSIESFYISKLGLKNIRAVPVERRDLYRLEKLIFTPLKSRKSAGFLPEPYLTQFRSRVLPKRPSKQNLRIYLSRSNQQVKCVENEKELMSALGSIGFVSIIPDELSLEEEIEIFYDAEAIVGPSGSAFANTIFSNRAHILELWPTWFIEPHYYFISKSLGHNYNFLCGRGEDRYPQAFKVDVKQVMAKLKEMGIN